MLLAVRVFDLRLVYTSQNAPLFLGVTPAFILGKTLLELLGPEAIASIQESVGGQQNVPTKRGSMSDLALSRQLRITSPVPVTRGRMIRIEGCCSASLSFRVLPFRVWRSRYKVRHSPIPYGKCVLRSCFATQH